MFDVSFSELVVIGVIALVVIGPERLPKVARTVGHLLGRAQRYVSDVKTDIQREMDLDEFSNLKEQMQDAAKTVKASLQDAGNSLRKPLDEATEALKEATDAVKASDQPKESKAEPASIPGPEPSPAVDTNTLPLPGVPEAPALPEATIKPPTGTTT
jgi:sec-independent protein translocase protein TatB